MALTQCRQCDKVFDTDLIAPGSPLLCVYCGFDNGGTSASPVAASGGEPASLPGDSRSPRVRCEWEKNWKSNPVTAYVDTLRSVITSPVKYFGAIKPFDDYVSLAVLMYINSFIGIAAALIFQLLIGMAPMMFTRKFDEMAGMTLGAGFGLCFAFVMPLFSILGIVIGAGIMHFFLRTVGGTRKNFDTTFTVYGLSTMANVFTIVPFLGNLGLMVYSFIINIGGQAEAHEIPPAKAFVAFLLPMLICCCCLSLIAVGVPSFLAAIGQLEP